MHFQHPESRKNHTFRFFSNFSRHGSCGYATKLQKQHKIRIWPLSVHCATQLRIPADRTALSLNCFFPNKCAKLDVRSWSKSVRTTESIRKFNFSIITYINERYKVVLHERTKQVHHFKFFRFHMKFTSVHPYLCRAVNGQKIELFWSHSWGTALPWPHFYKFNVISECQNRQKSRAEAYR